MKIDFHKIKSKILCKASNPQSILFHIVGFACIIWFLVRIIPKPDRIRYPCQQMSITFASSYIIFWIILWSTLFHGLGLWIKRAKYKTVAFAPAILVVLLLVFSVSYNVFELQMKKKIGQNFWITGNPSLINPSECPVVQIQVELFGFGILKQ